MRRKAETKDECDERNMNAEIVVKKRVQCAMKNGGDFYGRRKLITILDLTKLMAIKARK